MSGEPGIVEAVLEITVDAGDGNSGGAAGLNIAGIDDEALQRIYTAAVDRRMREAGAMTSAAWAARRLFGTALRTARSDRGWSQQRIADNMTELGFSWHQTTCAKTEAGDRPVPLEEAAALAALLGTSVGAMLDEAHR